ncbi:hypothetical protein JHK82_029983 [Glycine max]|nr:hypothetical protein JHK82_029983 [Glycine max]KAG5144661.1 hypothetical protein JHK84_030204 [Glycine max]
MELCVFNDLGLGGRFQLHFQNGVLLLSPLSWPTQLRNRYYYRIDASHSPSRLVFDELGNIYVETVNGTRIQPQGPTWGNSSLDPKGYYYRATLEFNGVFTQYAHPRSNNAYQGWTIMRFVPDNICTAIFNDNGSSSCGYNSYCSTENNRLYRLIRGTRGYVAPKWFKNIAVTVKVDVCSFGVMLLEIIRCTRSALMVDSGEEEKTILTDWASDCHMEGRIDALVENNEEVLSDNGRLQKWVKIALRCIHEQPEMGTTMGMVMQMLEGFVQVP